MFRLLVVLCVVSGVVLADPISIKNRRLADDNALELLEGRTELDDILFELLPEKALILLRILKTAIGFKVSAMSLVVSAIGWLSSNCVVIIVGALAALGFCKLTGKCTLNYEEYLPVAQLRSYATPEYLDTAQRFLTTAIEKYAETKRRSV
ncbi:uncharacterized protein LOC106136401 [Amyelois transitella]|uniref:uncharacterized protein LOC106136401 n=1 Tax=Amyelois transitella TaxID=680683 RepID=UPI00067E2696|nr:uncharacterized protein LOC106136401 [Amyelois transitella]